MDVHRVTEHGATGAIGSARQVLLEVIAVGAAALAVAFVDLRLWAASLRVPFFPENDGVYYLFLTRMLGHENTYLHSAHLGFPYGFDLSDYAEGGDNAHWFVLWLAQKLGLSPIVTVNLFYIATFAVVAIGAYVALRSLRVQRFLAGALAVLYSFLPYHVARGANHLFLSQYALVPLGVVVALKLLNDEIELRSRRFAASALLMVGLASTGVYGLAFVGVVVFAAAVLGGVARLSRQPVVAGALLLLIGMAMFAVNTAPSILARVRHGRNVEVANRSPFDTERFGLRPAQLVLPRTNHRIDSIAARAEGWRGDVVPSEDGQQLGLVGAVGLLMALGAAVTTALGRRPGATASLVGRLGVLSIVAIGMGAVGGGSLLLAFAGVREVRSWNRIVVVIGFCALAAVGLALTRALRDRSRLVPLAAVGVLLLGLFDQTSGHDAPNYERLAARHSEAAGFYAAVAGKGRGTTVFTWPPRPFPESGYFTYDAALGYLYQPDLVYGFGAMRGRHPNFALEFDGAAPATWVPELRRRGFTVLVVDLAERERTPDLKALAQFLGDPFATSARFSAFSLT